MKKAQKKRNVMKVHSHPAQYGVEVVLLCYYYSILMAAKLIFFFVFISFSLPHR